MDEHWSQWVPLLLELLSEVFFNSKMVRDVGETGYMTQLHYCVPMPKLLQTLFEGTPAECRLCNYYISHNTNTYVIHVMILNDVYINTCKGNQRYKITRLLP